MARPSSGRVVAWSVGRSLRPGELDAALPGSRRRRCRRGGALARRVLDDQRCVPQRNKVARSASTTWASRSAPASQKCWSVACCRRHLRKANVARAAGGKFAWQFASFIVTGPLDSRHLADCSVCERRRARRGLMKTCNRRAARSSARRSRSGEVLKFLVKHRNFYSLHFIAPRHAGHEPAARSAHGCRP